MFCAHRYSSNYGGHHLIRRERDDSPPLHSSEGQEEGEKILVCCFCQKPGNYGYRGSLYHCVECCNRPVHPSILENHILKFTKSLENDGNKQVVCWGCDQSVLGAAYKCSESECSFVIHDSCAQLSYQINHPLHPDHALSLRQPGQCHCVACCTSHDRAFFYNCDSCDFQLGIKCINTLPTNPNDCHHHQFFSILGQIHSICNACGKEIKNIACLCSICKILVHYRCADIPRITKIKLHNHFLNLIYSPHKVTNRDNMFCRFCAYKVNTKYAAYYCHECSYILHTECLALYREMYKEPPTTSETMPNKSVGRVTHLIKAFNQAKDEGPHPGEIQHFSHQQHKLIICDDAVNDNKFCEGCMEFIILAPFYGCVQCNFFLHTQCAKLPMRIDQHQLHKFHPLTFLPRAPIRSYMFYCFICRRSYQRGFIYKCDKCPWIHICVQCALIPETLKHEGHQHSLFLPLDFKHKICQVCPKENTWMYAFVCTICNFILGINCANLPLVARHKYDKHLLKLTYAVEDDSGEYYCLICEEKRDPHHWFYYCAKCDFPAHPECIISYL